MPEDCVESSAWEMGIPKTAPRGGDFGKKGMGRVWFIGQLSSAIPKSVLT